MVPYFFTVAEYSSPDHDIFTQTLLRPLSPDPIFNPFLEVAFVQKTIFYPSSPEVYDEKSQILSKHVMRDLGVLSGVLFKPTLVANGQNGGDRKTDGISY